jgi:hypothetical protein
MWISVYDYDYGDPGKVYWFNGTNWVDPWYGYSPQRYNADYFSTSTKVGWAASPSGFINVVRNESLCEVMFSILGTSDSSITSFTVPYNNVSSINLHSSCEVSDNGAPFVMGDMSIPNGSKVVTVYSNLNNGLWTATGQKIIRGRLSHVTTDAV